VGAGTTTGPCTSPDGHDSVDHMLFDSYVPAQVRCTRCGRAFQVVVFEEGK